MPKKHLHELLKKVKINKKELVDIQIITENVARNVFDKTDKKKFIQRSSLKPLIEKLFEEFSAADVEENLRKARVNDIKREKALLEAKLDHINQSIEKIDFPDDSKYSKPNLQIEKFRREYYEELKKKSDENSKKTREYYQEQKKRQKKTENHLENLEEKLMEEKLIKLSILKESERKFDEAYKLELRKMHENTKKRKRELDESKSRRYEFLQIIREKPLFQKMEEKFMQDFEIKELEKRKAELAKKRLNYLPLNKQDLLEHIKRHDTLIKEKEKLGNISIFDDNKNYQTKFTAEILKQDKQKKIEEEKLQKEKIKRLEDRISYGESVREMYSPTVDKFKQMELALRLEKLKNPVIKKKLSYERNTAAQSDTEIKRKLHKKIPKELIKERNMSKPIDYLAERRKMRKEENISYNEYSDDD